MTSDLTKKNIEFLLIIQNLIKDINYINNIYYISAKSDNRFSEISCIKNYISNINFIGIDFSEAETSTKYLSRIKHDKLKKLIILDLEKKDKFSLGNISPYLLCEDLLLAKKENLENNLYKQYGVQLKKVFDEWVLLLQKVNFKFCLNYSIPA